MKKKFDGKDLQKKKKVKKSKSGIVEESENVKGEVLDVENLREGTILLGCVIEVRSDCFLVSLPGCLVGRVHATRVSAEFTDRLKRSTIEEEEEVYLEDIVQVGELFPCRVMQVTSSDHLKKPIISLSTDPKGINGELKLHSLYLKMVLYAAVQSVEDHGYVMDIGIKGAQGFLPFNEGMTLAVGQVVPTTIRKLPSPKSGNVVWLNKIGHDEPFPQVEDESLKLSSILPGTNVAACITRVTHPFLYMKCMNFNACANVTSLGSSVHNLTEGMTVNGTVLYVHPVTRMIYLHLGPKPSPSSFSRFFHVQKYDLLKNIKYEYGWHASLFFRIRHGAMGFLPKWGLPEKGELSHESLQKTPVIPKARVIFLHYMDNLVQISLKSSLLNMEIIKPEDVKVGDIYEGVVRKHIEGGMFVRVCPGLSGFVRHIHMSDVLITVPEKLHPIESKVKCRVLSKKHKKSELDLTCKESLLNLSDSQILSSYEDAQQGFSYKGVIVQKTDMYALILFFNDVKGLVSAEDIPESSIYYVGQTVSCEVLHCNPSKQKLKLSLMGGPKKHPLKAASRVTEQVRSSATSANSGASLESSKTRKAIVTNITAHQLNIVVEGTLKGRVHITELGSSEEGCLPLKEFSIGSPLKVYCLGQYNRRMHTFLHITHRRTKQFLECSLEYPPPMALHTKILPGMKLTGFVKEIGSKCAVLWLSPTKLGILDYLNFSQNPKILRKMKKHLKVGLSLSVTVLEVQPRRKDNFFANIKLTKLEENLIEVSRNVVGWVESASPEEGLVLQLAHGYHGVVCLTDLQDTYTPVTGLLAKYQKLQYILCHILAVDHKTKECSLSLRKSSLYRRKLPKDGCAELSAEDVKEGKCLKGFVRKISGNDVIVTLGRELEGKIIIHSCETLNCVLCNHTQSVLEKYPPGCVIEVLVNGEQTKKGFYPLVLPNLAEVESSTSTRLEVTEDIDWDNI